MFNTLKEKLRRAIIGDTAYADYFSRSGKMDTGFKWGEALDSSDTEFAARRDALGYRLTFGVAEELFRRGFIVEKVSRERDAPGDIDEELTDEVMDLCYQYDLLPKLAEAVGYERREGWAVICILKSGGKVWLEPKSERMINNINFDEMSENATGEITRVQIARKIGNQVKYLWVTPENFILIRTRPRDELASHKGTSVLEAPWDIMETIRKMTWGTGQRDYRLGGLLHVQVARANQDKLEQYAAKFGPLAPRTDLFTDDQTQISMPALGGGSVDVLGHFEFMLYQISIQTGIPSDVLRGESEATLASGAISHHSYFSYLSAQQTPLLPVVVELLAKLGFVLPDDRVLKFRLEYELDPKDDSLVKLNEVESIARRVWVTPNEQRQIDPVKLGKIEGGDELPMQSQPFQPAGSTGKQQPRSPAGDAEETNPIRFTDELKKWLVQQVEEKRSRMSVKDACGTVTRQTGLQFTERSYYNWRNEFG